MLQVFGRDLIEYFVAQLKIYKCILMENGVESSRGGKYDANNLFVGLRFEF